MLLRRSDKRLVVAVRSFYEKIKRSLRLDAGEAVFGKLSVEKLAVSIVDLHIHLRVKATPYRLLNQGRRVHES